MVSSPVRDRDARIDANRFRAVRSATTALCASLAIEDHVVQSMPDCSPVRWHLAHTTWFFETFVLRAFESNFRAFHASFEHLFNSYYQAVGVPLPRDRRGTLSRPTVAEVMDYRAAIDERMAALLDSSRGDDARLQELARLGLHHEQQHQELILTDVKHAFAQNPLRPCYATGPLEPCAAAAPIAWHEHAGGIVEIGHAGGGFAFDNEGPRHAVLLRPFALAARLVTQHEFAAFIADGGYRRPELWLSEGWQLVTDARIAAPLYVDAAVAGGAFTLRGTQPIDPNAPVAHVSFFEADAYARWSGARLPLEAEWESVAAALPVDGNFVESGRLHPAGAPRGDRGLPLQKLHAAQMFGDVWEWTSSPYSAYPGYRPAPGAVGEYNGKFMINQIVLRGGSCATPRDHVRASYRNFFPPTARWQFSGIRLATDLDPEARR